MINKQQWINRIRCERSLTRFIVPPGLFYSAATVR